MEWITYHNFIAAEVPYPAHNWKYLPNQATDVASESGRDWSLWIIGKAPVNGGFTISQYDHYTKKFMQASERAVRIAVGSWWYTVGC